MLSSSAQHNHNENNKIVKVSSEVLKEDFDVVKCRNHFGYVCTYVLSKLSYVNEYLLQRQYIPSDLQKAPVYLHTFPGSGNTWTRLLLDFATGYYSGSIYTDKTLLKILPGLSHVL